MKRLTYIGSKESQLKALKEEAIHLLKGLLSLTILKSESDDIKRSYSEEAIKSIDEVEELEEYITLLDEEKEKLEKRREEESYKEPDDDLCNWYYSQIL